MLKPGEVLAAIIFGLLCGLIATFSYIFCTWAYARLRERDDGGDDASTEVSTSSVSARRTSLDAVHVHHLL